jgi:general secretion pathway protein I
VCSGHSQDQGFTLLEVLVAFVIAALALAEVFSLAASGVGAVQVAGRYQQALSRAQSHLAAIGPGIFLVPGVQRGDDGGGFHWSLKIAQVAAAAPDLTSAPASVMPPERAALYSVSVAESWEQDGHTRVVRLDTKRVGPAPGARP